MTQTVIRSFGAAMCALVFLLQFAACEQRGQTSSSNVPDRVVVYASYADRGYLPALFDAYTEATDVVVVVRHGNADKMVDDVIGNTVSPPADVLLTPSVFGVWRSADEGALRPLRSTLVEQRIPAWLRDSDSYWVALSYRTAAIAYDASVDDDADLSDYTKLANPEFEGRLCLSSSTIAINQAVIAMLIDASNLRATEITVRGWIANLARPVFDSEDSLLAAIESGECALGIASSQSVARASELSANHALSVRTPANPAVDIEGMGVARHAHNPDGARVLIEWLSTQATQAQHAAHIFANPANPLAPPARAVEQTDRNIVAQIASHGEEAIKLAERAHYR